MDSVTTGDLQLWFDRLDAAPRTIRNLRSAAAALFRFAESRCYIGKGDNPAIATERIKAKNGDAIEIYTPDELARLLAVMPDSIKPAMAIQAFTGIRTAELARLDWQAVKLERGHIEITAANAKTASRRIVPILPNLAAWLKLAAKKTGKILSSGADYYHEQMRETAGKSKTDEAARRRIETQRLAALVYFLPRRADSKRRASRAGSGQLPRHDIRPLPRTGDGGRCESMVCHSAKVTGKHRQTAQPRDDAQSAIQLAANIEQGLAKLAAVNF